MSRRTPRSTTTDTLLPYTTPFRYLHRHRNHRFGPVARVDTAEDIMSEQLKSVIEAAWEARDQVSAATRGEVREAVDAALSGLDNGSFRVAEKGARSEEHTSELQSLMRISYAVFCLNKKKTKK